MKPLFWPGLLALSLVAACGSNGETGSGDGGEAGGFDSGLPEGYVPVPDTLKCTGDSNKCLSGTFALKDFTAKPTATKVTLFKLFPRGTPPVVAWTPVAKDGTFAFSNLDAWGHYYLQGEARFTDGSSEYAVISEAGSFAVPSSSGSHIGISVRPVFLEVLQQAPVGGKTSASWASAHLYDPATGKEVTQGTVSLTVANKSYPMPYGTGSNGTKSFNVTLPANTPGGNSFTITTSYSELKSSPVTWTLAGEPATFGGAISSPVAGNAAKDKPLVVKWQAQPMASFTQTELYLQKGTTFHQVYVSPSVVSPEVTTETIPAKDLATAGMYLLNEDYTNATCPTTADGCVYNLATAPVNLIVQ